MKPEYHPEYPFYLTEATNKMFGTLGRDFFYASYSEDRYFFSRLNEARLAIENGCYALERLSCDQDFHSDIQKKFYDRDIEIEYYLRNEHEIRAIEKNVLIQAGMNEEAARFLLNEAMKLGAFKRGFDIQEEIFLAPRYFLWVAG